MTIPTADEYLAKVAASTNRRIRTDAGDVEKHSVDDQLKVERRLRSRERASTGAIGIAIFKMKPGGPMS